MKCTVACVLLLLLAVGVSGTPKALSIYFIDTEGGQATLLVSPSAESLLIDVGFPAPDSAHQDQAVARDADRIAAAAKLAKLNHIDAVLITHHHRDHVGGALDLTKRLPVSVFYDHGPSVEDVAALNAPAGGYAEEYSSAFAESQHKVVVAGDKIPLEGLDVTILSAAGKPIARAGEPNPYCKGLVPRQEAAPGTQGSEDPQSVAVLVQFGKFRFANFGDGRWNRPLELLCPNNLIGKLDVLETPGHGTAPPLPAFGATMPRVAVADNGAHKGGGPEVLKGYQSLRGFEALWLLHFYIPGGEAGNPPAQFIANMDEQNCQGNYLKISAAANGSFTVYNSRTNSVKAYRARSNIN